MKKRASKRRLVAAIMLPCVLGACTTEPEMLDISGSWSYSDSSTSTFIGVATCASHGTLVLRESGGGLGGVLERTGRCTDGSGAHVLNDSDRLFVDGGLVTGQSVWFTTGDPDLPAWCRYTATITGSPPNGMAGSLTCGRASSRQGTWSAMR